MTEPWRAGLTLAIATTALALSSLTLSSCSATRSTSYPDYSAPEPAYSQHYSKRSITGVASWYGPGFNGRRTATGERYNQEELTAASPVLPLGSRVMVTNLENGRSVPVRINDRGPFIKGRKIDLSHAAARHLGVVGPGTAHVRMDVMSTPPGSRPPESPMRHYVQVGSYAQESNARNVSNNLRAYYHDVVVDTVNAGSKLLYRVRMGAFSTREAAAARARESVRFGYPTRIISE